MQLTDEHLKDLIESWKSDFGEVLTVEQARAEASRLLGFFTTLSEIEARTKAEEDKAAPKDIKEAWKRTMR